MVAGVLTHRRWFLSQQADNFSPSVYGNGGTTLDVAVWIDPVMLAEEGPFVRHLLMGLKSEGHKVTFIAPSSVDLGTLPTLGSRVCTYRWNRWERIGMIQRLRLSGVNEELVARPADVLLVWGTAEAGPVEMVQEKAQLPGVVWCWDGPELFSPLLNSPHVKHAIVSSEPIADRAGAELTSGATTATGKAVASKVPVTLIHPGVYAEETIACYDVEGQLPCLVCLDPLADLPSYEALIRACRKIADEGVEFLLFAYDTGRAEHPIWKLAEELHLLDRVSFVPFQQDAEPLLLHGDLYLHVFPTSRVRYRTLEAMARGLAVVTIKNTGADYLTEGQTCRIVPTGGGGGAGGAAVPTVEAWREVLLEMIRERGRAAGIARRGQQLVRDRHSMTRTLMQFISVCRQAAGTPFPLVR